VWRTHKSKLCNLVSNEYYCLGGQIVHRMWAKRPGGESSKGRIIQGAKRPRGEPSWWRNI